MAVIFCQMNNQWQTRQPKFLLTRCFYLFKAKQNSRIIRIVNLIKNKFPLSLYRMLMSEEKNQSTVKFLRSTQKGVSTRH